MKRILFVDDEPRVLDGLKRMLRSTRDEWDLSFANNGYEALSMLEQEEYDIIVSDIRMPGMSGVELLEEVRKRHPRIVRIALSGQAEKETIYKAIGPVHQFLSKPCEAEVLKIIINQAYALHEELKVGPLESIACQIRALPSLPEIYRELVEELSKPNASIKRIEFFMSHDIGMSAKVLQLCNSAFFGVRERVTSPGRAVHLLGLDTMRSLVLTYHVFSQYEKKTLKHFSLERLWEHSIATAAIAQKIAEVENAPSFVIDQAFVAGMLHDVGRLVFASEMEKEYAPVMEKSFNQKIPVWKIEQKTFGTSHAELGAYLLGLWGIPDSILEAVAFHHTPKRSVKREFDALTVVHAANSLACELQKERDGEEVFEEDYDGVDEEFLSQAGKGGRLEAWREIARGIKIE